MSTKKPKAHLRPPPTPAPDADAHVKEAFVTGKRLDVKTSKHHSVVQGTKGVTQRTRKHGAVRRTTVYLEHDAYARLRLFCARRDQDLSSVVSQAVVHFLDAESS